MSRVSHDSAITRRARRGFTLVEVLVALVIAAGISAAATIAIFQALRARTASETRQQAHARADAAAERVFIDAQNLIRDADLFYTRVLLNDGGGRGASRDELLIFASSATTARGGSVQAEGGQYEIQYRVVDRPQTTSTPRGAVQSRGAVLWRRVDPVPDEVPDGGGVVFPVAEGILSFSVQAFDGKNWEDQWDSDRDGLPHALRIVVRATSDRDARRTADAVRVVPIDRIPLPLPSEDTALTTSGGAR